MNSNVKRPDSTSAAQGNVNERLTILREADLSSFSGDTHRKSLAVGQYALQTSMPMPTKVTICER